VELVVNETDMVTTVTTDSGALDLPVDPLPENLRGRVEGIRISEPPPLMFGGTS
jgi:hypothetical protein